ncbi:hypothetical protein [Metabacillus indicus]|uniref:hypothetical protein n=1 Tax=Metabacillus indicus TaxID=246786 RepID=UPI0004934A73|nr:hypothetical protein [Metabacillus indicus]KEZ52407.1 hypothetical protein AZ46_0201035 [Metabacillus indicus LMG 22858]
MSKKSNRKLRDRVRVVFLNENEEAAEFGLESVVEAANEAVEDTLEKVAETIEDVLEEVAETVWDTVEEVAETVAGTIEAVAEKKEQTAKMRPIIKKVVKKVKPPIAFGSLYNADIGGFAVPGVKLNFTSEGPEYKTRSSISDDTIRIKKDGVYEIIFLTDVMTLNGEADFGIFRNNTLINEAKFSVKSGDLLQTTVGKVVQLELEKGDEISVRTIFTNTPDTGYDFPDIRYMNSSLTVKLLMKD